jgi:predicted transcriptional regulator
MTDIFTSRIAPYLTLLNSEELRALSTLTKGMAEAQEEQSILTAEDKQELDQVVSTLVGFGIESFRKYDSVNNKFIEPESVQYDEFMLGTSYEEVDGNEYLKAKAAMDYLFEELY